MDKQLKPPFAKPPFRLSWQTPHYLWRWCLNKLSREFSALGVGNLGVVWIIWRLWNPDTSTQWRTWHQKSLASKWTDADGGWTHEGGLRGNRGLFGKRPLSCISLTLPQTVVQALLTGGRKLRNLIKGPSARGWPSPPLLVYTSPSPKRPGSQLIGLHVQTTRTTSPRKSKRVCLRKSLSLLIEHQHSALTKQALASAHLALHCRRQKIKGR